MNKKEIKIMNHLVDAWNEFVKLDIQHPDEQRDFADGIHKCQYLLGMRVARKYKPEVFENKNEY